MGADTGGRAAHGAATPAKAEVWHRDLPIAAAALSAAAAAASAIGSAAAAAATATGAAPSHVSPITPPDSAGAAPPVAPPPAAPASLAGSSSFVDCSSSSSVKSADSVTPANSARLPPFVCYILAPRDIVLARSLGPDDHIGWMLSRGLFEQALQLAVRCKDELARHSPLGVAEAFATAVLAGRDTARGGSNTAGEHPHAVLPGRNTAGGHSEGMPAQAGVNIAEEVRDTARGMAEKILNAELQPKTASGEGPEVGGERESDATLPSPPASNSLLPTPSRASIAHAASILACHLGADTARWRHWLHTLGAAGSARELAILLPLHPPLPPDPAGSVVSPPLPPHPPARSLPTPPPPSPYVVALCLLFTEDPPTALHMLRTWPAELWREPVVRESALAAVRAGQSQGASNDDGGPVVPSASVSRAAAPCAPPTCTSAPIATAPVAPSTSAPTTCAAGARTPSTCASSVGAPAPYASSSGPPSAAAPTARVAHSIAAAAAVAASTAGGAAIKTGEVASSAEGTSFSAGEVASRADEIAVSKCEIAFPSGEVASVKDEIAPPVGEVASPSDEPQAALTECLAFLAQSRGDAAEAATLLLLLPPPRSHAAFDLLRGAAAAARPLVGRLCRADWPRTLRLLIEEADAALPPSEVVPQLQATQSE